MSPPVYVQNMLKISIGQILQTIGFQTAQSSAIDILVNVLERYIMLLSKGAHDFSELANRSEPTLDDLARSFEKNKVTLVELEEFINSVDTPDFSLKKHIQSLNKDVFMKKNASGKWADLIPDTQTTATTSKRARKSTKTNKDYLGYCDDPTNKELLERLSDEENEYVYDYFPLMVRPLNSIQTTETLATVNPNETINGLNRTMSMSHMDNNETSMNNKTLNQTAVAEATPEQTIINKNGTQYQFHAWKPYYEPKFLQNYLQNRTKDTMDIVKIESNAKEAFSSSSFMTNNDKENTNVINNNEINMTNENAKEKIEAPLVECDIKLPKAVEPLSKLPPSFQRPKSKYKKQVYQNAIAVYNKSNLNSSMLPKHDIYDDNNILLNKLKSSYKPILAFDTIDTNGQSNGATEFNNYINDETNSVRETNESDQVFNEKNKAIELVNIKIDHDMDQVTSSTVKITEASEHGNELIGIKTVGSSNLSNKTLADQRLQDVLSKYSSNSMNSAHSLKQRDNLNLIIKKTESSSSSNFQVKKEASGQAAQGKIPKLTIKTSASSGGITSVNVNQQQQIRTTSKTVLSFGANSSKIKPISLNDVDEEVEESERKENTNRNIETEDDLNISKEEIIQEYETEESVKDMKSKNKFNFNFDYHKTDDSSSNMTNTGDNYDDNACDGTDTGSDFTSGNKSISHNKNIEPIIWKPVFNINTTTNSNSSAMSSPRINKNINDEIENISTNPPTLSTFTTKKSSFLPNLGSIVDYSSNSNENSNLPIANMDTIDNKSGNKDKNEIIDTAKINTNEKVIDDTNSSAKHKKKKKNKDKEKEKSGKSSKEKDREKDKDKKHHHKNHHHKKKDKEKHKLENSNQSTDQLNSTAESKLSSSSLISLSPSSNKKKDKKLLKKLLKKEQKKGEKSANSPEGLIKSVVNQSDKPNQEQVVDKEKKIQKEDSKEPLIQQPLPSPQVQQLQPSSSQLHEQPRLPKLKLKLNPASNSSENKNNQDILSDNQNSNKTNINTPNLQNSNNNNNSNALIKNSNNNNSNNDNKKSFQKPISSQLSTSLTSSKSSSDFKSLSNTSLNNNNNNNTNKNTPSLGQQTNSGLNVIKPLKINLNKNATSTPGPSSSLSGINPSQFQKHTNFNTPKGVSSEFPPSKLTSSSTPLNAQNGLMIKKKPSQNPSILNKTTSNLSRREDVELGEIIRPKSAVPFESSGSNLNEPIPKFLVKPFNKQNQPPSNSSSILNNTAPSSSQQNIKDMKLKKAKSNINPSSLSTSSSSTILPQFTTNHQHAKHLVESSQAAGINPDALPFLLSLSLQASQFSQFNQNELNQIMNTSSNNNKNNINSNNVGGELLNIKKRKHSFENPISNPNRNITNNKNIANNDESRNTNGSSANFPQNSSIQSNTSYGNNPNQLQKTNNLNNFNNNNNNNMVKNQKPKQIKRDDTNQMNISSDLINLNSNKSFNSNNNNNSSMEKMIHNEENRQQYHQTNLGFDLKQQKLLNATSSPLENTQFQRSKPSSSQLMPRSMIEKQNSKLNLNNKMQTINKTDNQNPVHNPSNNSSSSNMMNTNKIKKVGIGGSASFSFNSLSSMNKNQETDTIFTPTITMNPKKQKFSPSPTGAVHSQHSNSNFEGSSSHFSSLSNRQMAQSPSFGASTSQSSNANALSKRPVLTSPPAPKSMNLSPPPSNISVSTSAPASSSSQSATMKIISTVVKVNDAVLSELWICPFCNKPDDSSPMIGCDSCDDWYHWHCIGLTKKPPKNQNWYCHKCGTNKNTDSTQINSSSKATNSSISPKNQSTTSSKLTTNPTSTAINTATTNASDNNGNLNSSYSKNEAIDSSTTISSSSTTTTTNINNNLNHSNENTSQENINSDESNTNNFFNPLFANDGPSNYLNSLKKKKKKV